MNFADSVLIVCTLLPVLAGLAAWMFRVHAKLAVIANQLEALSQKLDQAIDDHRELWNLAAGHEARLEGHDAELRHLAG